MLERLAVVALRAVVQELEDDPAGAAAALARLLGAPAVPPMAIAPSAPAPSVHRDVKPANGVLPPTRPRKAARPSRKKAKRSSARPASAADALEVGGLLDQLAARHGDMKRAAVATKINEKMLSRWRTGRAQPKPASLERLRAAVAALDPVSEAGPKKSAPAAKARRKKARAPRFVVDAPAPSPSGRRFGAKMRDGHRLVLQDLADVADEQLPPDEVDAPELEPETPREDTPAEVAQALVEKFGELQLAERFGFRAEMLTKIRAGGPCTPSAFSRLRSALASEPVATRREKAEAEGGNPAEEPAELPDDEAASA